MVAGEGRDVTELMRLLPGAVAKDGFEGVQLVGLPDGRAVAVKISDGGDRARMPVTVRVLEALDVDTAPLQGIATGAVLGGGRQVGLPDGRAIAVKISDGGDRARMPVTVRALEALDVDTAPLAGIATGAVLGGGRPVGLLRAADLLSLVPANDAK
jgi:L-asparaginase II